MDKQSILEHLKRLNPKYEQEGVLILGLFGSYANDNAHESSDIDIAYRLDYDKLSQSYQDGCSKLLKLNEIRHDIQNTLHKKIDFVLGSNQAILQSIIYVQYSHCKKMKVVI